MSKDKKGYFAFEVDETPYIPVGGRKDLKSIMQDGGFINFDTAAGLKPYTT